jgi:hypothetical protein
LEEWFLIRSTATLADAGVMCVVPMFGHPLQTKAAAMALAQAVIGVELTSVLAVPAQAQWTIVSINLCNTTSTRETITVHAVPQGQDASTATTLLDDLVLLEHETKVWEHRLVLGPGDALLAIGSFGGRVTATVSYVPAPAGVDLLR